MACPYARFIEPENETSTATTEITLNGTVSNDALAEILSLTGYDPKSAVKPELIRLPSSDELINYSNYLQLNKILNAQSLSSSKHNPNKKPVHDEHFFIITHQSREKNRFS